MDLIGWILNVMIEEEVGECQEQEYNCLVDYFIGNLDVDDEFVGFLIEEGFIFIEEVVYVLMEEMFVIEGFDEEMVIELCCCVKDVLLNQVLVSEEVLEGVELVEDFLNMEGMDCGLVFKLVGMGVCIMEDLVEQFVGDLFEIEGMDEECVGQLIMVVCVFWFEDQV